MNQLDKYMLNHEEAERCFQELLGTLNKTQPPPMEAASALINILTIVWAKEIGGSREDLVANIDMFFERVQAMMNNQGGSTQ